MDFEVHMEEVEGDFEDVKSTNQKKARDGNDTPIDSYVWEGDHLKYRYIVDVNKPANNNSVATRTGSQGAVDTSTTQRQQSRETCERPNGPPVAVPRFKNEVSRLVAEIAELKLSKVRLFDKFCAENEAYKMRVRDLNEQNRSLQIDFDNVVRSLEKKITDARAANADMEESLLQQTTERQHHKRTVDQLNETIAALERNAREQNEKMVRNVNLYNEDVRRLQNTIDDMKDEREKSSRALKAKLHEDIALKNDLFMRLQAFEENEKELKRDLALQIEATEVCAARYDETLKGYVDEMGRLAEYADTTSMVNDELRRKIEAKEREASDAKVELEARIAAGERREAMLKGELLDCERKKVDAASAAEAGEREIAELKVEIDDLRHMRKLSKNSNDEKDEKIEILLEKVMQLEENKKGTNKHTDRDYEKLLEETAKLRARNAKLKGKLDDAAREKSQLAGRAKGLGAQVSEMTHKAAEAVKHCVRSQKDRHELQTQLRELKQTDNQLADKIRTLLREEITSVQEIEAIQDSERREHAAVVGRLEGRLLEAERRHKEDMEGLKARVEAQEALLRGKAEELKETKRSYESSVRAMKRKLDEERDGGVFQVSDTSSHHRKASSENHSRTPSDQSRRHQSSHNRTSDNFPHTRHLDGTHGTHNMVARREGEETDGERSQKVSTTRRKKVQLAEREEGADQHRRKTAATPEVPTRRGGESDETRGEVEPDTWRGGAVKWREESLQQSRTEKRRWATVTETPDGSGKIVWQFQGDNCT